jgi:hypothetical protein
LAQEEKQFFKKCQKKRKKTILLKYEMKVLSTNTIIHIAIMLQKTWDYLHACDPSKSLGIFNGEKL